MHMPHILPLDNKIKRMKYIISCLCLLFFSSQAISQYTQKPPLHGRHWMAITGKPLAATAGATVFQKEAMQ